MAVNSGEAVLHDEDPDGAEQRPGAVRSRELDAPGLRDARADAREAALEAREKRADARDADQSDREEQVQAILADADERDGRADARDSAASSRDATDSLSSFLKADDFGTNLRARRSAALDRLDSKDDRTSSATDRTNLTDPARPERAQPGAE